MIITQIKAKEALFDARKDFVQDSFFSRVIIFHIFFAFFLTRLLVSFYLIHIFTEGAAFRFWLCEEISDYNVSHHEVQVFVFNFQETIKIEILVY